MEKVALILVLSLCILHSTVQARREHVCSHKEEYNEYNRYRVNPGPRQMNTDDLQASSCGNSFSESFKMAVYYDDSVNTGLSKGVRDRIKNKIVPILTKYFDNVLSVRPLKGPILIDRSCTGGSFLVTNTEDRYCANECEPTTMCGTAQVPSAHLKRCAQCKGSRVLSQCTTSGSNGAGVDASFVLYVSAKTSGSCPTQPSSEGTIAFAGSCGMEEDCDRPIVGYANFCPYSIDDSVTDDFIVDVAKHEIHHALGFSFGQFAFWRDESGNPRTPRDGNGNPPSDRNGQPVPSTSTMKDVGYADWDSREGRIQHTVYQLVTPKIVEEGKKHFGCSTLKGVELENQGGSGTAFSHWEKRILENEGMTGVVSHNPKFSRLTYALLEDSGWYKVNYAYAEKILWGANSGCSFSSGSCKEYMDSQSSKKQSIAPFCDYLAPSGGDTGCTFDRSAKSQCNMVQYSSALPNDYQYFNTWSNYNPAYNPSGIGGRMQIADFCPYQSAFSNGQCDDETNQKGSGLDNSLAETYGSGSRCFKHADKWSAKASSYYINQQSVMSGCYKYSCSSGKVNIDILGKTYTCSGSTVQVSQTTNGVEYTGSIVCPSCAEICYDDPKGCPQLEAELLQQETSPGSL